MAVSESLADKLDEGLRSASYRILQAVTSQRQARIVVWASAALSVAAIIQPDLLPRDLLILTQLLNVNAIHDLLKDVAEGGDKMSDEDIAARMEALLPLDQLEGLATGQKDILRVLTKQRFVWQRQIVRG